MSYMHYPVHASVAHVVIERQYEG